MTKISILPFLFYMLKRLATLTIMYLITLSVLFALPRLIPSNPVAIYVEQIVEQYGYLTNPDLVPKQYKAMIEEFGFGKPLWEQYIGFIAGAFRGDLGTSIWLYPSRVLDVIMGALPWTLFLLIPSSLIGWYLGNLWGARTGFKRGSFFEKLSVVSSSTIAQIPSYWLAMLLIYGFAVYLRILPSGRAYDPTVPPSLSIHYALNVLKHYILPFTAITVPYLCGQVLTMRNLIIYELKSDYTVFGDYIGLREKVVRKYAFRNAVMPQIVGLSIRLGRTVAGAALVEALFSYPGMGYYMAQAVSNNDYMLLQGIFVILVATVYLAIFISDFVHMIIDPRVRLGYVKQ